MIRMEIRDFEQNEWSLIVSNIDTLSLMQTWEFGETKCRVGPWKVWRAVFYKGEETVGAVQAMIRIVPFLNRGLVWINRAPIIINKYMAQADIYIDMLKELKEYWVDKKNMYLRIAPSLITSGENYAISEKAGYLRATERDGWVSEIVDLSLSLDELRKGLEQKWRNCLNKSERMDVVCEIGSSDIFMEELLGYYKILLRSKGFVSNLTPEYLRTIQNLLPDSRKMLVFIGRRDGERLGGILIASYGNTCIYLIGATNDSGKEVNVSYYLLWNAICEMKKRGFRWLDVGGAHPEDTPLGILHFKRGLKGNLYQLMGEVDAYKDGFINRMIKRRIESL